jgi:hypothetical protein
MQAFGAIKLLVQGQDKADDLQIQMEKLWECFRLCSPTFHSSINSVAPPFLRWPQFTDAHWANQTLFYNCSTGRYVTVDIQNIYYNGSTWRCVTVNVQILFYNGPAGRCVTVDIQILFYNGSTDKCVNVDIQTLF